MKFNDLESGAESIETSVQKSHQYEQPLPGCRKEWAPVAIAQDCFFDIQAF